MTFDADIVQERLGHMYEIVQFLDHTGDVTGDQLEREYATRFAVERAITQLVELAVSINSHMSVAIRDSMPTTYRESFDAAARAAVITSALARDLAPSAGLRNILIHRYVRIDLDQIADSLPLARDGYRRYITEVAQFLKRTRDAAP